MWLRIFTRILRLVEKIGPHVCMLKLHSEFQLKNVERLIENLRKIYQLRTKHNFLIFEDRKFADGGETIQSFSSCYVNVR